MKLCINRLGDSGSESDSASIDNLEVSDGVFSQIYNEFLVHQIVTSYQSKARSGNKAQKTRAEVSGGGAKPWRQKGTGRARAGTIRSPLWRKGGKTFAAIPRDFSHKKVNRKMYEGALRSIWSELFRQNRVILVDKFLIQQPKTKEIVLKLKQLGLKNALIIHDDVQTNLALAVRNLHQFSLSTPETIRLTDLIAFDHVLITVLALKRVEEKLQ